MSNELIKFWIKLKNDYSNYLGDSIADDLFLEYKSNPTEGNYEIIIVYIKFYIEQIGYSIIRHNDYYRAKHLESLIKDWNKCMVTNTFNNKNEFYGIFKIYIKSYIKYNTYHYKNILMLLTRFSICRKSNTLLEIMNISIDYKLYGFIDILRNIINVKLFMEKNLNGLENTMNARKLHKYLIKI